ncbi:aromatic-ring-hydroxylating dioxygenase subunit beta [Sphingopyxis granuli]|uniref:aromatic-ring-hydroxylating dioxygenase subunit beta n=1 Tax=Sphingopyxis granuli TaxID=267128 RepID=UPI001F53C53A|nr:aromatic-ring-hydroxylating dioxygenase subunit beta [Sphingopyxis granuli]UNK81077.1 aromatic-ring-hydroxylating dioxygenase subunit beta [Sphingopyxis granuli]
MAEDMTMTQRKAVNANPRPRADYEDFLYTEAALLDEWRLDEWFDLVAPGAIYEVPTAGAPDDADSAQRLFYIADDHGRLKHRVARLNKPGGHSEWPRSVCSRQITNVRVLGPVDDGVEVACTFATRRSKNGITDIFFGHMRYVFVEQDGQLKIASKRVFLDMTALRPQGRVSIIL